MPYQEPVTESPNNMTPEEYLRLLGVQRRVLQSQGGAAPRRQVDTSFPSRSQQQQQQLMQMQMQAMRRSMPPQPMMEALHAMQFQGRGNMGRDRRLHGNTLHQSMTQNEYSYGFENSGSSQPSRVSRSFAGNSSNSNHSYTGESRMYSEDNQAEGKSSNGGQFSNNNNRASSRSFSACGPSLSRSFDPRLIEINDLDNEMMASSFHVRRRFMGPTSDGGNANINNINGRNSSLFASTQSDRGVYADSTRIQGYNNMRSSPQANLPALDSFGMSHDAFQASNLDNDKAVDLTNSPLHRKDTVVESKRRRLNSDELVLDMLSGFMPKKNNGNNNTDIGVAAAKCPSPPLSPFSRRAACSPLTPLNKSGGHGESSSPMGRTPILFAEFFLGRDDEEETETKAKTAPPPPPLYQKKESTANEHRSGDGFGGNMMFCPQGGGGAVPAPKFKFNEVQFDPAPTNALDSEELLLKTPFSSEPLCLPPRRKKDSTPRPRKKVAPKTKKPKSPAKPKEEVVDSPTRNMNHVITPSSAAIVALSTEIRNKIQTSPGAANDSPCASPKASDKDIDSSPEGTKIMTFATSMEASQFSQQSIHDWDRKMGLRRAHSKTMRESARSRKKVLEFLKGDGSSLLKSVTASGLMESTSTAATFMSSLSGASPSPLMFQMDDDVDSEGVKLEQVKTVNEGSEEEKSEGSSHHPFDRKIREPHVKQESMDDDDAQEGNDDKSIGSIGSFSHGPEDEDHGDDENLKDSHEEFMGSYSSKMLDFDIEDEELTSMFRRASLDHCNRRSSMDLCHRRSSSVLMPMPEDLGECKQSFARSA